MDTTKNAGWQASALYLEKVNRHGFAQSRKLDDIIKETEVNDLHLLHSYALTPVLKLSC